MLKTLPIPFEISGTKITLPFSAICTVTDKRFSGEIVIEYVPKGDVLEYVDVEEFTKKICQNKITAEELVHTVYQEVTSSLRLTFLKVLVDVKQSEAHQPVQVWKEGAKDAI